MIDRDKAIQDEAEKAIYTVVKENHVGAEYEDHHCAITGDNHSVHHLLLARTAKKLTEHIALAEAAERVRAATEPPSIHGTIDAVVQQLHIKAEGYRRKAEHFEAEARAETAKAELSVPKAVYDDAVQTLARVVDDYANGLRSGPETKDKLYEFHCLNLGVDPDGEDYYAGIARAWAMEPQESADATGSSMTAISHPEIRWLKKVIADTEAEHRAVIEKGNQSLRHCQNERDRYKEQHEVGNRVIRERDAEIRALHARVTEQGNALKEREAQHKADKQVIKELQGVIVGLRRDVANQEKEIERANAQPVTDDPTATVEPTEPPTNLDPLRSVTREEAIEKAESLLAQNVALTESAERVRSRKSSSESAQVAIRDWEINKLRQVITRNNEEITLLSREIGQLKVRVAELSDELSKREEQRAVDKQGIEELQGVIATLHLDVENQLSPIRRLREDIGNHTYEMDRLRKTCGRKDTALLRLAEDFANQSEEIERAKAETISAYAELAKYEEPGLLAVPADYYAKKAEAEKNTPEESRHGFCGDEDQRPAENAEPKLDPCRPVMWSEWHADWHIDGVTETATRIVRSRVAEALAGTVPKANYDADMRRVGRELARSHQITGTNPEQWYLGFCGLHGVDPEVGEK